MSTSLASPPPITFSAAPAAVSNDAPLDHLDALEAESIYIMREVVSEFENPVMLYSVGKDSSVMVHLALKAFYPGKVPFPLLHVDTGFKYEEMYTFRDAFTAQKNLNLQVYRHPEANPTQTNPYKLGRGSCCGTLKTQALLQALAEGGFDAAFGGARRDEEKSRAKERIFSFRDQRGQWDPKNQRPEVWQLFNGRIQKGESIRVFPLSNWTEQDVWHYIQREQIPVVPLYFAKEREVINLGGQWVPTQNFPFPERLKGERKMMWTRFRSLGCSPCSGAVPSSAESVAAIIEEMNAIQTSERATRMIDHDQDDAMEAKKREGYF